MSDAWYYAKDGKPSGPLDLARLRSILSLTPDAANALIWARSFKGWVKAREVVQLSDLFHKPPATEFSVLLPDMLISFDKPSQATPGSDWISNAGNSILESRNAKARERIEGYGFSKCADVRLRNNKFIIENLDTQIGAIEKVVYVFVIADLVMRVGSSSVSLASKLAAWQRDVSRALQGDRSATSLEEASAWRKLLTTHGSGTVYARAGHEVTTPLGTFAAYLDEENLLIDRFNPPLNRRRRR